MRMLFFFVSKSANDPSQSVGKIKQMFLSVHIENLRLIFAKKLSPCMVLISTLKHKRKL